MSTCQWEQFTGIDCKKDASKYRLLDSRTGKILDVCEEHFNEYRKDKGLA